MYANIHINFMIRNIFMSNKYPTSPAIVHLELSSKEITKNVLKDFGTKLYLTSKCSTIDDSLNKSWPPIKRNAKQAPNLCRRMFNDTKRCLLSAGKDIH